MTTCTTFAKSIKKRIKEGKDLDTIASELCTDVKFSREKVIRVIKDFLGAEFLEQNAETLGYDVDKANLAKKRKSHKKIDTPQQSESEGKHERSFRLNISHENTCSDACSEQELAGELKKLVNKFGFDAVMSIIAAIQQEMQEGTSHR